MAGNLVISRKQGQRVFIDTVSDGRIEVTVMEMRGNRVKIGFTASPAVNILREELDVRTAWGSKDVH